MQCCCTEVGPSSKQLGRADCLPIIWYTRSTGPKVHVYSINVFPVELLNLEALEFDPVAAVMGVEDTAATSMLPTLGYLG